MVFQGAAVDTSDDLHTEGNTLPHVSIHDDKNGSLALEGRCNDVLWAHVTL